LKRRDFSALRHLDFDCALDFDIWVQVGGPGVRGMVGPNYFPITNG
jgi:hypothetical protein